LAHPHRDIAGAPETRQLVPDELPVFRLENGDAARWRRRERRGREIAMAEVGRGAVVTYAADVGRMRGLDREPPHRRRDKVERDVVLLGAQRRHAGIDHVDGEVARSEGWHRNYQRTNKERTRALRVTTYAHTRLRNWPHGAGSSPTARSLPRSPNPRVPASDSRPVPH